MGDLIQDMYAGLQDIADAITADDFTDVGSIVVFNKSMEIDGMSIDVSATMPAPPDPAEEGA